MPPEVDPDSLKALQSDVEGARPKLDGYWRSQLATTKLILSETFRIGADS